MSKRKQISQAEARALKRRVAELEGHIEDQRRAWTSCWPSGVHLTDVTWAGESSVAREVLTARKLGHAVVATASGNNMIRLFALPLAEQKP